MSQQPGHISPSQLEMWIKCPQQWMRRYIQGEKIAPGIAMHQGTGVHGGAEVNHKQKIDSWKDLPLDDCLDAARDAYNDGIEKHGFKVEHGDDAGAMLARGMNVTIELTTLYHAEVAPLIQPVLSEETIMLDLGLELPMMIILDAYTIDNRIPDLKTARRKKQQLEVDTSLQLTAYAGGIKSYTGEWPSEVSLEVLIPGNTKSNAQHQHLASQRDERDWDRLVVRSSLMLEQIKTGLFPPCTPDHWMCQPKWCGYWHTCEYGRVR